LDHVTWPRARPLDGSISLKFSLETRLEYESFESLINFVVFMVLKLLCGLITYFVVFRSYIPSEPKTPASHPK